MANDLAKLNRLRVNAGKAELKSWKASQPKLNTAITSLEEAGFKDVLPGANLDAQPVTTDPEIASALDNNIANPEPPAEEKPRKVHLARGLDTDTMGANCRYAVRQARAAEKKAKLEEKAKLSPEDKAQIKAEAKLRKGEVDPKKDSKKAKRQKKHIEEKQAKRKAEGKVVKSKAGENEITVADIARDLDIDPKVARAKLRRHEDKLAKLRNKGAERWVFPKSAKAEIMKILK